MIFIYWLIAGGLVGGLAALLMSTRDRAGIVLHVAVGMAGSALGGWMQRDPFKSVTSDYGDFSFSALVVPLLVALVLLAFLRLTRGAAKDSD